MNDKLGCESPDADHCKHNWPEYTTHEGGDEINKCLDCKVSFFGFINRLKCYVCAYAGTATIKKVKR